MLICSGPRSCSAARSSSGLRSSARRLCSANSSARTADSCSRRSWSAILLGPLRLSQYEPLMAIARLHLQAGAEKRFQGDSLDGARPIEPASRARKWCGECACRSRTGFKMPPLRGAPDVLAADDWGCAPVAIVHATSSRVLHHHLSDDEARAAMESRPEGHDVCRGVRWWRTAGITATQAGSFGALSERLSIGVPPGRRAEHFGGDPENDYF
jgi:hypothetical protein